MRLTLAALLALAVPCGAQISSFPYLEDFESGDGGYAVSGSTPTWSWGAPAGAFIDGAASGANAWVTNLAGAHAPNEFSYLVSPVFDFTGEASDPTLSFSHQFERDPNALTSVEYSFDGNPFIPIGLPILPDPFAVNWFNDVNAWSGASGTPGTWRTATHRLVGAAGKTVQLRWLLNAGATAAGDGVGIDDVEVTQGPIASVPYFEDFESDDGGYVVSGDAMSWEYGTPAGFFIDAADSGSGAWVTGLASPPAVASNSAYLESVQFDCTDLVLDPVIEFSLIYELNAFDRCTAEYSIDGGPFTLLSLQNDPFAANWYGAFWGLDSGNPGEWVRARHVLPGAAGHNVVVRWKLVYDPATGGEGVGIDDVVVVENGPDVGVAELINPVDPWSGSSDVEVLLRNFGSLPVAGIPVTYHVDGPTGPATVTEVFVGTLDPGTSATFTFSTPIATALGTFSVDVATEVAGDAFPMNDAVSSTFVIQTPVTSFPYLEDFESGPGEFVAYGFPRGAGAWEHGEPMGPNIDGAAAGSSNAWVTNLGGFIANEVGYVQSPPFDLSGFTVDPSLRFRHTFAPDAFNFVEMSVDGGPWELLGDRGLLPGAFNWYNSGGGWTTNTFVPWRVARVFLEGTAGKTISLRWGVNAGLFPSEGVGIDRVEIIDTPFEGGQEPRDGLAVFDAGFGAHTSLGFPIQDGFPGPYYADVPTSVGFNLRIDGEPLQPVILFFGPLSIGAQTLPGVGQVDIAPPTVIGNGLLPTGINIFFFTDATGRMDLTFPLTPLLNGVVIPYQAAVMSSAGLALTNAVEVEFVP